MARIDLRSRLERGISELEAEVAMLRERAEEAEANLEKLKSLLSDLDDLPPVLLSMVEGDGEEDADSGQEVPAQAEQRATHFDRIVHYLQGEDNQPRSIAAIEEATGIGRASVAAVLYRTHPGFFKSINIPDSPNRAKAWRLFDPHIDSGREEEIPF